MPLAEREAYDALQAYSLSHGGSEFVHQHVVDAWVVQHADDRTKPIAVAFGLIGLFLHLERDLTGRQVQRAHMAFAGRRRAWPRFALPESRGDVDVVQVMGVDAGPGRDEAIRAWCASVWEACTGVHGQVERLVEELYAP